MRWRTVIAAVLLVSVLAGGVLLQRRAEEAFARTALPLQTLAELLEQGAAPQPELLQKARDSWQESRTLLSVLCESEALEEIGFRLQAAESLLRTGKQSACAAVLRELVCRLEEAAESGRVTVDTVF